jgi:surface antigen
MRAGARLAVVLLALAGCWLASPSLASETAGSLRVRGYPYAAACPAAGVADVVDRWKLDECNCTSYAAWALTANGQRVDWFVPGAMDARNWPHVASLAGIAVGAAPRPGAVAVWPQLAPPFGHVAYVTRVEAGGRFDVAEYNFPGGRRFGFDERMRVSPAGAVFIYVPLRG